MNILADQLVELNSENAKYNLKLYQPSADKANFDRPAYLSIEHIQNSQIVDHNGYSKTSSIQDNPVKSRRPARN